MRPDRRLMMAVNTYALHICEDRLTYHRLGRCQSQKAATTKVKGATVTRHKTLSTKSIKLLEGVPHPARTRRPLGTCTRSTCGRFRGAGKWYGPAYVATTRTNAWRASNPTDLEYRSQGAVLPVEEMNGCTRTLNASAQQRKRKRTMNREKNTDRASMGDAEFRKVKENGCCRDVARRRRDKTKPGMKNATTGTNRRESPRHTSTASGRI